MARETVDRLIKRAEHAWSQKANWDDAYRDAYDFAMPQRNLYDQPHPGQVKGALVFDSTAIKSTNKFANRIVSSIFPPFRNWAKLEAGPGIPDEQRDEINATLDDVTKKLFAIIHHSSKFQTAVSEAALDLAAGTAPLLILPGPPDEPIVYKAIPQIMIALEEGPNGAIAAVHRRFKIKVSNIRATWPDAVDLGIEINTKLTENPNQEVDLWEITYTDQDFQSGVWYYDVIYKPTRKRIVKRQQKSMPWAVARWIKAANETHGRGPLLQALPDIRTANKIVELVLKNAAIAIAGPYTVTDDGVTNPDTIAVTPGAMITVARNAGSPGGPSIAPLERSGSFDIAALELERLQDNIKGMMFDESLPPLSGPVRSATEIIERAKDLAEDTGAAFGRLISEFMIPIVQRSVDIMVEKGIIDLPAGIKIGGTFVKLVVTSPLAQLQNLDDVKSITQAVEITTALFGPEVTALTFKVEDLGAEIAQKFGVSTKMLRNDNERAQIQNLVAQMISQQQQAAQQGEAGAQPRLEAVS